MGSVSLGLTPRAAIETYDTSASRLDRIAALIRGCRYSLHDLSAVGLDSPVTLPRFNMPLELGLAIAEQYRTDGAEVHQWIAFDSVAYRPDVSLSDLKGYEALNHHGTAEGVLREMIGNMEPIRSVTFQQMQMLLHEVQAALPEHLNATGADTIFSPAMFKRISAAAVDFRTLQA